MEHGWNTDQETNLCLPNPCSIRVSSVAKNAVLAGTIRLRVVFISRETRKLLRPRS